MKAVVQMELKKVLQADSENCSTFKKSGKSLLIIFSFLIPQLIVMPFLKLYSPFFRSRE